MTSKTTRILIVDDDPDIQILYTAQLSSAGYDVSSACDARSCLASIVRDCPDLVVLDLGLPGGDGEEALRVIRSNPAYVELPILILSGRPESEWGDRLRNQGAGAYLQKPATPVSFFSTVQALLKGEEPQSNQPRGQTAPRPAAAAPARTGSDPVRATQPTNPSAAAATAAAARPQQARPGAVDPPSALPQQIGTLSCPHCGHDVAGLNATLDPAAIDALARARRGA